ncbi:MAG: MFS transporter [bacterium]|nr:MFS transporter [bacterium]
METAQETTMLKRVSRFPIYALGFLFSIHFTIAVYINSTFLATLIPDRFVGALYSAAALITIVIFLGITKTLRKAGDYQSTVRFLLYDAISLAFLAFVPETFTSILAFLVHTTTVTIIYFNFDVLLENYSNDTETGLIRGSYLTLVNVAWVVAPLLASLILGTGENYRLIYMAAFLLLLPTFFLVRYAFKQFKDPEYQSISVLGTIHGLATKKSVRMIVMASFLLQFFFSWMVIYAPIYMHSVIGMDWRTIGIILSVVLLPYVFLEAPLGWLADTKWGEKEILTLGFVIIAVSTAAIAFITTANFLIWASVLFFTRAGASMIEIMSETYLFKVINSRDIDILSFFRMMRPVAYIVGPALGTVLLVLGASYTTLFAILGAIMLFGIRYSLALEDTK